jgi:hypothetical protein
VRKCKYYARFKTIPTGSSAIRGGFTASLDVNFAKLFPKQKYDAEKWHSSLSSPESRGILNAFGMPEGVPDNVLWLDNGNIP